MSRQLLRVPCTYQGGKQRVAAQIVDVLLTAASSPDTHFYDLCCGSGAISIELVNRGVCPSRIHMVDASVWGVFWSAIGTGSFRLSEFDRLLSDLPSDKRLIKAHLQNLASRTISENRAELYPVLQAGAFGGKQIWQRDERWVNAYFRDYWEPTETSVRRSPANPMQPSPIELRRRVHALSAEMKGVWVTHGDINTLFDRPIALDAVVYVDPPYQNTTGYGFNMDIASFAATFREVSHAPLFVSEGVALSDDALPLHFGGANGGVSGARKQKHQEWLSRL